jgi:hypothetical protein
MGVFPSSDVISFFELRLIILASRFEPCSRPGGFLTSSNSHTVAVFYNGCTNIPISSGKGSGGRGPSFSSAIKAMSVFGSSRLDLPGLIRSRRIGLSFNLSRKRY